MRELIETPIGNVKIMKHQFHNVEVERLVGELKSGCQRYVVPPSRIILDVTLAMNGLRQRGVVS